MPAAAEDARRLVRLGKGLAHPVRAAVLVAIADAGPSPLRPVALARRLGLSLGVVSYHVRSLAALGLIELHSTEQVRGAVAHDYVAAEGVRVAVDGLRRAAHGR
ncbi:MAG TPA: winged helix-turn-helix domain-containing protein [Solirubrobacteraceae bacterium]|jgi:DNA-binding transcriptional ArsR family regulator|nr:winged helix-turn-helix domain-containing protein [Solirubrobacteraceae bacterium]